MRLDPVVRDYRASVDEFTGSLNNASTRIYLDTSLLMWLMRLGAQARAAFMQWCASRPEGTIRVPVWAAHELHRHIQSGTVRTNLQNTLSETHRKYGEFTSLATERADESLCRARGYAGRDSFIGELERSVAVLDNLARVVELELPRFDGHLILYMRGVRYLSIPHILSRPARL